MSAYDLHLLLWDLWHVLTTALMWLVGCGCMAALVLSPFVIEWVMDGMPNAEQAAEMYLDDVKGGWR